MPPSTQSAGQEAVELAASAGLFLDPWQVDELELALAERADGTWAAGEVGLIVPRQNGKGSILEARELAGLFLFDEQLILHSAHEFKTAVQGFRRVWSLIEQTPDLLRRVKRKLENNNDMSIELVGGQILRFVARSTGSGRGFTGDTVILDEAYNLTSATVSALSFTMGARPNPQLWYTSSAPLPKAESAVLRRLCRRGRAGESPRLAYSEYCADKDDDMDDDATIAKANPGLYVRLSMETVRDIEQPANTPEDFARERGGIWFDELTDTEWVLPESDWQACANPKSGLRDDDIAFALDVSPARVSAAFAVAGRSGLGGVHVEVVEHLAGTGWVVARAKALHERWGAAVAIAAGSPAAAFVDDLEAAGVPVLIVSVEDHAAACDDLLEAVTDHGLLHIGQPELNAAVAGAEKRAWGDGSWLWSRKTSTVDIAPLVAVTLALHAHSLVAAADSDFFVI